METKNVDQYTDDVDTTNGDIIIAVRDNKICVLSNINLNGGVCDCCCDIDTEEWVVFMHKNVITDEVHYINTNVLPLKLSEMEILA